MKITTNDGMVFEGTQAEYEAFLAFAERKLAEQEADETPYVPQEGDIVVTLADRPYAPSGKVGKVTEIDGDDTFRVHVPGYKNNANWFDSEDVRKATPAEVEAYEKAVADASKPKLKAGDFVKFSNSDCYSDITLGKAYEVYEDGDGELAILDDVGDERNYPLTDDDCKYEILSADEAAKQRESEKWAKIDRKFGEFRKGDIVRVTDDMCSGFEVGALGVVDRDGIEEDFVPLVTAYATDEQTVKTYWAKVEIVAPVESTLK